MITYMTKYLWRRKNQFLVVFDFFRVNIIFLKIIQKNFFFEVRTMKVSKLKYFQFPITML